MCKDENEWCDVRECECELLADGEYYGECVNEYDYVAKYSAVYLV